jgi:hypothetical protein
MCNPRVVTALVGFAVLFVTAVSGQRLDVFVASRNHPAISYANLETTDRVTELNKKLQDGRARLTFDSASGYLRSVLDVLAVPVESQVALFSQNSSQGPLINMRNPRTLFFNDAVAVGYVRGGNVVEVAAEDPRQGVIFYSLEQKSDDRPQFKRDDNCLACHLSWSTLGVPGFFLVSTLTVPEDKNAYASGFTSDHRTAFSERWGGLYVTGDLGSIRHVGNKPISTASTTESVKPEARQLESLDGQFDSAGYLSRYSDVVALMVLEHQVHMTNLITRMGWESRLATAEGRGHDIPRVRQAAIDLVDYLLFVYETPLANKIRGTSGFSEKFTAMGPMDGQGRSLRQLDLERRLMKYPCSYMIYSEAFNALPEPAKALVYEQLWQVLSGRDKDPRFSRLSAADRQAIVEILRDTQKELPPYFRRVEPSAPTKQ